MAGGGIVSTGRHLEGVVGGEGSDGLNQDGKDGLVGEEHFGKGVGDVMILPEKRVYKETCKVNSKGRLEIRRKSKMARLMERGIALCLYGKEIEPVGGERLRRYICC